MHAESQIPVQQHVIGGVSISQSISERLQDERRRLEFRLDQINTALTALENNPEVAETVDAIAKLGHIM